MDASVDGTLVAAIQRLGVWLPWMVLVSTRVGVTMASMPAPFGSVAPTKVRVSLGLALAAMVGLAEAPDSPELLPQGLALISAGVGEAVVGAVIGLTVRVTLAATEVAGTTAALTMGLGFGTTVDPMYGESASVPTRLLATLGIAIFFVFEGHHAVVRALAMSLQVAPPGRVTHLLMSDGVVSLGSRMLARGLQIAAPVLGTMMIIQLGTALASRAAPKVPLMYLSFAVTSGAGVLTLYVAAPAVATAIVAEVRHLPMLLEEILRGV